MTSEDRLGDRARSVRMDRRSVLRMAAALPVVGTIAASALKISSSGPDASAQTGTAFAGEADGTPVACASPVAASPVASPVPVAIVKMTTQLRFDPEKITIKVGETVQWDNVSNMPHTATDDPAKNPVAKSRPDYVLFPDGAEPWSSKLLQPGDNYAHTFTVPGEYNYFCIPHVLSGMRGMITVVC